MPARMDRLLEQIDQALAECDAPLPPLTSSTAAAVLDYLRRVPGVELTPWQQSVVRAVYSDQPTWASAPRRHIPVTPTEVGGRTPQLVIVDELQRFETDRQPPQIPRPGLVVDLVADEPRAPWWRRWWPR